MSNKSGISSQVISLPKGGGALQGNGEKFSPDLVTGTGDSTVPLALPPGQIAQETKLDIVGRGPGVVVGEIEGKAVVLRRTSEGKRVRSQLKRVGGEIVQGRQHLWERERLRRYPLYQG